MSKSRMHERGFTLIEMSIVLIIIGLIIGGILKGQELIESARQKNFISQIDALRAGVNTFVDRFENYPGDATAATACTGCPDGNQNGVVGDATTYNTTANLMTGAAALVTANSENTGFFSQLAGSNILGGVAVTNAAAVLANYSGGGAASSLPNSAFPQSGFTMLYGSHSGVNAAQGVVRTNWIRVARFPTAAGAVEIANDAIISPARAFQLDTKYDDGSTALGTIRTSGTAAVTADSCGNHAAIGTSVYAAATTTVECVLIVAIE